MKTVRDILKELHDDDPELAHLLMAYVIKKYGRNSTEWRLLFSGSGH